MKKLYLFQKLTLFLTLFLVSILSCSKEPKIEEINSSKNGKNITLNSRTAVDAHEIRLYAQGTPSFRLTNLSTSEYVNFTVCDYAIAGQTCENTITDPNIRCFKWDNAETDYGSCRININTGVTYMLEELVFGQYTCGNYLTIYVESGAPDNSDCVAEIQRWGYQCWCIGNTCTSYITISGGNY